MYIYIYIYTYTYTFILYRRLPASLETVCATLVRYNDNHDNSNSNSALAPCANRAQDYYYYDDDDVDDYYYYYDPAAGSAPRPRCDALT